MKNLKTNITPQNKLFIVLAVAAAIALLTLGSWYYFVGNNSSTNQSQVPQTDQTSEPAPNKEATSEDSTFPVPGDTPDDAVKNYVLVTENEQFKIRRNEANGSYIITLYAIINNPNQYDYYKDQLRQYKQAALEYLQNSGLNPSKLDITYEPEEAKDL